MLTNLKIYLYSFLDKFCNFWYLEAVTTKKYFHKHFLLHASITNYELIVFNVSILNTVYLESLKGHQAWISHSNFLIFDHFRSVKENKVFIKFHNQNLEHVFKQKYLGIILDCDLTFN